MYTYKQTQLYGSFLPKSKLNLFDIIESENPVTQTAQKEWTIWDVSMLERGRVELISKKFAFLWKTVSFITHSESWNHSGVCAEISDM